MVGVALRLRCGSGVGSMPFGDLLGVDDRRPVADSPPDKLLDNIQERTVNDLKRKGASVEPAG